MKSLLNYPGGKWRAAPMICAMMPEHHSYLEPFFGSGAVFFNKEPSEIETVNDLDGDIVNFFSVIREHPQELAAMIETTPYARQIYDDAYENRGSTPIERAYKFAIRSKMGFGFKTYQKTGFKIDIGGRERAYAVKAWGKVPETVVQAAARLKNVQIENKPALDLIYRFNRDNVLMYLDPPYVMDTRGGKQYSKEMSDADHEELLNAILQTKAKVMLSGYASPMYDDALQNWEKVTWKAYNQAVQERQECLWCNFELKETGGATRVQ